MSDERAKHIGWLLIVMFGCILSVLSIAVAIAVREVPPSFSYDEESLSVSGEDAEKTKFVYSLLEKTELSGRALFYSSKMGYLTSGGVIGSLMYLSEDGYNTMIKKYKSIGACPAPFINKHKQPPLMLISDNVILKEQLDGGVKEGDRVKIRGRYLGFDLTESMYEGDNFSFFDLAGGRWFLLESFSVNGQEYGKES